MKMNEIREFEKLLLKLCEQVREDIASSIDAIAEEIHPAGDCANELMSTLGKKFILEHNR